MTLQTSGPISVADINLEIGRTTNIAFDFNSNISRLLSGKSSGVINLADFYGKRYASLPWIQTGPTTPQIYWADCAISSNGAVMIAVGAQNYGASLGYFYTSTDYGATWTSKNISGIWSCCAISADGSKMFACDVYSSLGKNVHVSVDYGSTWTKAISIGDVISIDSSSDGSRLIAVNGYNGSLWTSSNSGVSWINHGNIGLGSWRSCSSNSSGSVLFAVKRTGLIYRSTDYGASWVSVSPMRDWNDISVNALGDKIIASSGVRRDANDDIIDEGYTYTSNNYGNTWTTHTINSDNCASSADGSHLVTTRGSGAIYTSLNSGGSWDMVSGSANYWASCDVSADGNVLLAVARNDRIYINPR